MLVAAGQWSFRLRGCDSGRSATDAAPPIPDSALCGGTTAPSAVASESAQTQRAMRPLLRPETLARFVDPLPVPPTLVEEGTRPDPDDPAKQIPYYRVVMREESVRLHRDLPPTKMWTYAGSMPGPTIEARSGQGLLVEWVNELPEEHFLPIDRTLHGADAGRPDVRAVVHLHGARVAPESDGYPEAWYPPGRSAVSHYPVRQDPTMLWYHDHAMGIERLNQYAGLFGALFVRSPKEEALGLPHGKYEIPLLLCDRILDDQGQLYYPISGVPGRPWVSEVTGHVVLANGKLFSYLDVEPRRYRLRIVNASNSRVLSLTRSDGGRFQLIGADQGLLPAPVDVASLELAPAERADAIVDFAGAAGTHVVLKSLSFEIVEFRVTPGAAEPPKPLPSKLKRIPRIDPASATRSRLLSLTEVTDRKTGQMLMLLDRRRWRDEVTERPELDSTEIWSFMNLTDDTHPIHLHAVRFQLLDRQIFERELFLLKGEMRIRGAPLPPQPSEMGWKDTVRVLAGTITRIIVRFEGYAGRYVWHCHTLEHAANEMMRPFEIVARP